MTKKEQGLLKGAIRRVFSRSELRKLALDSVDIEHYDSKRPRVKKWSMCPVCQKPTPKYLMQVDHQIPLVPLDSSLDEMTWDDLVNRAWCELKNLQPMCKEDHLTKTKIETRIRRDNKRNKK